MEFHVFRCKKDQDYFVITDDEHAETLGNDVCPAPDDELEKVGVYSEMGEDRVAFDEKIAKEFIRRQGYYRFEAPTFDPVAIPAIFSAGLSGGARRTC